MEELGTRGGGRNEGQKGGCEGRFSGEALHYEACNLNKKNHNKFQVRNSYTHSKPGQRARRRWITVNE